VHRALKLVLSLTLLLALLTGVNATKSKESYVSVQRDLRECMYPMCGGYWVKRLNHKKIRCADGSKQEGCYVAEADWSALGLAPSQVYEVEEAAAYGELIVFGAIDDWTYGSFEDLGQLVAKKAWIAATANEPDGKFWRIGDLGFVCFAYPCFSLEANKLNWARVRTISGLDLSGVRATADQIDEAWEAVADDNLLVAGQIVKDPKSWGEPRGRTTLLATQFYLPVEPLECTVEPDCTLSEFPYPVTSPDDCYCSTCPVPIGVTEAEKNASNWYTYCLDVLLACPQIACVPLLPYGCVANECSFLPEDHCAEPTTCDELHEAILEEFAEISSCTEDSQCGQVLGGTSCGCTRNWVARLDADTECFEDLKSKCGTMGCSCWMFLSTCDCPPANGFLCAEGYCGWNFIDNPPIPVE
jgi:hypothetical protein